MLRQTTQLFTVYLKYTLTVILNSPRMSTKTLRFIFNVHFWAPAATFPICVQINDNNNNWS